jgi:hypothetical protein
MQNTKIHRMTEKVLWTYELFGLNLKAELEIHKYDAGRAASSGAVDPGSNTYWPAATSPS